MSNVLSECFENSSKKLKNSILALGLLAFVGYGLLDFYTIPNREIGISSKGIRVEDIIGNREKETFYENKNGQRFYLKVDGQRVEEYFSEREKGK